MKYALLSASDKTGIIEFAQGLVQAGYGLLSTGGTSIALRQAGVDALEVSDFTGFPEVFGGRVKTLHPKVHGAILKIRDDGVHQKTAELHGISDIDIVAVNLYPFEATVGNPDSTFEDIIENIDIGGPAMVRSAAKNHRYVTVVVHSADYDMVLEEIRSQGNTSPTTRIRLAAKAYSHTALYDSLISGWMNGVIGEKFPQEYTLGGRLKQSMRYGENPHQLAAFYTVPLSSEDGIGNAEQLQGKALSFNNIADAHAALELVKEFHVPGCAIIKHMNPSGAAEAVTLAEAYQQAYECDPDSAYGGIIAVNAEIDKAAAEKMAELFVEVIIAPSYSPEAMELFGKKKNLRLLKVPVNNKRSAELDLKRVTGGFLLQDRDLHNLECFGDLTVPTKRKPTAEELKSLEFAWNVCKHVKSNAIVYVQGARAVGIGAGQQKRVDSGKIAADKSHFDLKGSVMASDAFFPFRDSVDEAAARGITAIVSPGGSIRDDEVIAAADEAGIAMVFTGIRHFRH